MYNTVYEQVPQVTVESSPAARDLQEKVLHGLASSTVRLKSSKSLKRGGPLVSRLLPPTRSDHSEMVLGGVRHLLEVVGPCQWR